MKTLDKLKELKLKSLKELKEHKTFLLKEQFALRMQKGSKQLNKNHMFKIIRHDIARINTLLFNKE